MAPKRKVADDGDASGAAPKKAKASTPRLKKAGAPDWEKNPRWSQEKPDGEWLNKAVDRWNLLPPYNPLNDALWKKYYEERDALEAAHKHEDPEATKKLRPEELCQDSFTILWAARKHVADAILGSVLEDEERKTAIARTLRTSLYFLSVWGNDEGDGTPRTVNAKTRLYSPFGIGTALDIAYDYHFRMRFSGPGECFSMQYVHARHTGEMSVKDAFECIAVVKDRNGRQKPEEGSVRMHNMTSPSKISGTTPKALEELAEELLGVTGWLSPLQLYRLLSAAGTVNHYKEELGDDIVNKAGLGKFKAFDGESLKAGASDAVLGPLPELPAYTDPVYTDPE